VTILDGLAKGGIALVALKENIRVEGNQDIQTKVKTSRSSRRSRRSSST